MPVNKDSNHKLIDHVTYAMEQQDYTRKGGLSSLPAQRGRLNIDGAATSCISSLAGLG